jgi:hypothetical protein
VSREWSVSVEPIRVERLFPGFARHLSTILRNDTNRLSRGCPMGEVAMFNSLIVETSLYSADRTTGPTRTLSSGHNSFARDLDCLRLPEDY